MPKFKFEVGQRVRCTYKGEEFSGVVIARGRYTKASEKFHYTAGDRFYLVELPGGGMDSAVEHFLEEC